MVTVTIEPTGTCLGLSISKGAEEWHWQSEKPHQHSEMLVLKLKEGLEELGTTVREVQNWVVVVGPGSYTGTRIALAALKGIVLGLPRYPHLYALSSFEAIACATGGRVTAGVEIKKGTFCFQDFDGFQAQSEIYNERPQHPEILWNLNSRTLLLNYQKMSPKPLARDPFFQLEPVYLLDKFK